MSVSTGGIASIVAACVHWFICINCYAVAGVFE